MKIYEKIFPITDSVRGAPKLTVILATDGHNPPYVAIGNPDYMQLPLDEARKLARAILAIPRPFNATPEIS